jgi:hypothetical protein
MISHQTRIIKNIIRSTGAAIVGDARRVHKEAVGVQKDEQFRLAPKDTGALSESIRIEFRDLDLIALLEGGGVIDYVIYQEYGTDRQPGTPHIRPAFAMMVQDKNRGLEQLRSKYR